MHAPAPSLGSHGAGDGMLLAKGMLMRRLPVVLMVLIAFTVLLVSFEKRGIRTAVPAGVPSSAASLCSDP